MKWGEETGGWAAPSLPLGPTGKGWFPARVPGAQGLRTGGPGPARHPPPSLAGFGVLGGLTAASAAASLLTSHPNPGRASGCRRQEPGRSCRRLRQHCLAKQTGRRRKSSLLEWRALCLQPYNPAQSPPCCVLAGWAQQHAGRPWTLLWAQGGAVSPSQRPWGLLLDISLCPPPSRLSIPALQLVAQCCSGARAGTCTLGPPPFPDTCGVCV